MSNNGQRQSESVTPKEMYSVKPFPDSEKSGLGEVIIVNNLTGKTHSIWRSFSKAAQIAKDLNRLTPIKLASKL
jgi:hypothetical protein